MNKKIGAGILLFALFTMSTASASVIFAEAFGSATPTPITEPTDGTSLINGDFLITRHIGSATPSLLGDGLNEDTEWVLDFGSNASLVAGETLASALLTLTLNNVGAGVSSDTIEVIGLGARQAPEIRNLPSGYTGSITFDLLQYYTSASILSELANQTANQLRIIYEDDAIVSYAKLTLATVSAPAALPLICAGIAGWLCRRRRMLCQPPKV